MQDQQDITKYIDAMGTILRIHNFPDYEDYINEIKTRVNTHSTLIKYDAAWGALWAITRYPEHVIEDDMIVDCLSVSDLFFDEEQQQYFLDMFRIKKLSGFLHDMLKVVEEYAPPHPFDHVEGKPPNFNEGDVYKLDDSNNKRKEYEGMEDNNNRPTKYNKKY